MNNDTAFISIMAFLGVATFGFSLRFLLRVIELRHERLKHGTPTALADLAARLERIENAVETTALEVERVSEANRFVAKLLAERNAVSAPPGAPRPERVITPH